MIYLDHNATTQPTPAVIDAMLRALREEWANPSSIHRAGQSARRGLELAREVVADLLGADPADLVFTSGATEANDLALRGVVLASAPSRRTIVTSAVEHESVRDACAVLGREAGATVLLAPLDSKGAVDPDAFKALLDDSVALASVQWANNETGVVHPIERLGAACRARGIPFHTDATQWAGKMPTQLRDAPIDLASVSAHKMHGPKGVGALYVRRGVRLRPVLRGVQERERRGGTENTPGIAGFGAAAEEAIRWLARPRERERLAALRDRFERSVLHAAPETSINAEGAERLWNTTNIAFHRLEAEALLLLLSEAGVAASAGAACSSGSLDPSPVLLAMGVPPERAHGSLRFSLSRDTTDDEVERAVAIIAASAARLRRSLV